VSSLVPISAIAHPLPASMDQSSWPWIALIVATGFVLWFGQGATVAPEYALGLYGTTTLNWRYSESFPYLIQPYHVFGASATPTLKLFKHLQRRPLQPRSRGKVKPPKPKASSFSLESDTPSSTTPVWTRRNSQRKSSEVAFAGFCILDIDDTHVTDSSAY